MYHIISVEGYSSKFYYYEINLVHYKVQLLHVLITLRYHYSVINNRIGFNAIKINCQYLKKSRHSELLPGGHNAINDNNNNNNNNTFK